MYSLSTHLWQWKCSEQVSIGEHNIQRKRTSKTPIQNDSRDTVKSQWTTLWNAVTEKGLCMSVFSKFTFFWFIMWIWKNPTKHKNHHQIISQNPKPKTLSVNFWCKSSPQNTEFILVCLLFKKLHWHSILDSFTAG